MDKKNKSSKKTALKKELIQWAVILLVAAGLYATGYHAEVIGRLQSVLLYTGILQPDTDASIVHGQTADYNMPLLTLDGDRTSLAEFEGKTIFLNFWATWCPPCIAEMPNIQSLYEKVHSKDIVFVMASLDEEPQKARDFVARKGFTFPVYSVLSKPRSYDSSVVPTTYVIAPDGSIMMEHQGMAKYDTKEFTEFLKAISAAEGR
ncbi:TlpA family protein disulfide reductase [Gracilimonas mengyeensis]|uniref:Thiol-disulfide isomerase or thioredoxin n=1 Tax=Gracilimonas mengyeensis TaxID=1302730 RepID=A0A521CWS2_9BACT|nr:TlpA disulfide reductase family protein [Gracilimonas mengyeensis]SMO63858.1 Thiol-disulfide isomerase or thioredoxin [Gracilimonas mengyeensis]